MKIKKIITSTGLIGMIITVLFSPCCFPLFGFILTTLGLGSFELFGEWTMYVFQGFVLISVFGFVVSYKTHRCTYPLLIAIPSTLIIFYAYYFTTNENWQILLYIGMFGLLVATIINWYRAKLHNKYENCCTTITDKSVKLKSIITCPNCGFKKEEDMPTNACQFFYECEKCKTILKPKQGDCCVYCSYGSVPCPPIQLDKKCC